MVGNFLEIMLRFFIIFCLFFNTSLSFAWEKKLAVGFLHTDGNSPSKSNSMNLTLKKNQEKYFHSMNISTFSQSKQKNNTAEKYKIVAKTDKKISNKKAFYILFITEDDRFSGFDYQSSLSFGYAKTILDGRKNKLRIELGPGYRVSSIPLQSKEKEITFRFGEEYNLALSENSDLKQSLSISTGEDNTIFNFECGLRTTIANSLSLSLVYESKYTQNVPIGKKNNDSRTSVQFTYEF